MSNAQISDSIKPIDRASVHRITSGQVVIDLQTAVKELVENSLDAGATNIEVRFKDHGVKSIEVIDNGSGISTDNYEGLALKHHTSKLSSFEDLTVVRSFGFRGEALSSICALSESVVFTTAIANDAPMGTVLEMERSGKLKSCDGRVARQRGTTVTVTGLFTPLPVRRKEFERNAKREFGKALALLQAYALVPCVQENQGVRLTVFNQIGAGKKTFVLQTDASRSLKSSVSSLWGPKQVENLVSLDLRCQVQTDKASLKRQGILEEQSSDVYVTGLISKFSPGSGRTSSDRQFFYVNGRPCNLTKIQKAFNEVYRTFNANQSPFIVADFRLPTTSCDINVSPDKRTIFIHSEGNLILALKEALEEAFSPARSTYRVQDAQSHASSSRLSSTKNLDILKEEEEIDPLAGIVTEKDQSSELSSTPLDRSPLRAIPSPKPSDHTPTVLQDGTPFRPAEGPPLIEPPSKKPLFRESPEPRTSPERPIRQPDATTSNTRPNRPHPPLTQLSRNAMNEADDTTAAPAAEFLHVVSPVGTKRTYTTPAANRAIAASGLGSTARPVQTVLSTTGASWNLRRDREPSALEPRKKAKTSNDPMQKTLDFKARLTGFARPGSQTDSQASSQLSSEASEDIRVDSEPEADDAVTTGDEGILGTDEVPEDHVTATSTRAARKRQVLSPEVEPIDEFTPSMQPETRQGKSSSEKGKGRSSDPFEVEMVDAHLVEIEDVPAEAGSKSKSREDVRPDAGKKETQVARLELDYLSRIWVRSSRTVSPQDTGVSTAVSGAASISNVESPQKAEDELSRVIRKADFESMEVIGQFNKGFIVVRLRKGPLGEMGSSSDVSTDDLFLVDQHAADEKYNFETLQATTKIQSQQLIQPRLLELSAADELLAADNTELLRKNGFEVAIKSTGMDERERVYLTAQPVSKSTIFDFKDLEELLHLMQDAPPGQMVRCSKARNMFASRACRKSVMIGDTLTLGQMTSVVRHMASMDQPWNCPHGRPTMRHLSQVPIKFGSAQRSPKWEAFGRSQA